MSAPKGDTYVVVFALVVCVLCSLLLSATASALKKRQDYNVELDRKLNVLKAFGEKTTDEQGRKLAGAEVDRIFTEKIKDVVLDGETGKLIEGMTSAGVKPEEWAARARLPLYILMEGDEAAKYAFPISGKGLWSTIHGYLALDGDLSTIAGVTFYKHGETPGLGGECSADWFQSQFRGKKVYQDGQRLPFQVVKGQVADRFPDGNDHAVDGMSGATITGNGITSFINADLDLYEKYFSLVRKG